MRKIERKMCKICTYMKERGLAPFDKLDSLIIDF